LTARERNLVMIVQHIVLKISKNEQYGGHLSDIYLVNKFSLVGIKHDNKSSCFFLITIQLHDCQNRRKIDH